jgi:hypothetical protein
MAHGTWYMVHGTRIILCVMSGLRRDVDKNCAHPVHYAASSGNFLPTFRDNLSVPSSRVKSKVDLTSEDGAERLSRNAGAQLPFYTA